MLDLALEDPVGAAPLLAEGLLEPEDVAEVVVAGIREERFLILPHPVVADYMAREGHPERAVAARDAPSHPRSSTETR